MKSTTSRLTFASEPRNRRYDAVIIGSGPNGLAAGIALAQAGKSCLVLERSLEVGGGMRSDFLTLPGFVHDICATVHPTGIASPFFSSLPLQRHGVEFVHPEACLAHPLDGGRAVLLWNSLDRTVEGLGEDGRAYRRMMEPLVRGGLPFLSSLLAPPGRTWPLIGPLAHFGIHGLRSAAALADRFFSSQEARALLAGNAGHSAVDLRLPLTSSFGLVLLLAAHVAGWPLIRGGTGQLARALGEVFCEAGGEIVVGFSVDDLRQTPDAKAYLLDVAPSHAARMAGDQLPTSYRRRLLEFRHGPGAFKMDWVLRGPIPWENSDCLKAATVHVGGTLEEIVSAEADAWEGRPPRRPFVLLVQATQFDPSRSPDGRHTAWAYCHVPHASSEDYSDRIEEQIERFAPGFKSRIVARRSQAAPTLQAYNPNCIGGDVVGGANDWRQIVSRPTLQWDPFATPNSSIFLCSASTPPGGGVHGMCGWFAARSVLRRVFGEKARNFR